MNNKTAKINIMQATDLLCDIALLWSFEKKALLPETYSCCKKYNNPSEFKASHLEKI